VAQSGTPMGYYAKRLIVKTQAAHAAFCLQWPE